MSIIPASRLSASDLTRLGNNLGKAKRPLPRSFQSRQRRVLAAVNRSLAGIGERVNQLARAGGVRGF
jgi:hypothetical protein